MEIYVGSSSFRGSVQRFGFDLLELGVGPTLARPKVLAKYRTERPDLKISLRMAPDAVQAGPAHPEVARTIEAAQAAEACCIVLPTGPRFSPTQQHRNQLGALVRTFTDQGLTVGWEPRGVFGIGEARRWADEAGALLVCDITQQPVPPGPVVYTRLLPLGFGAKVTQHAIDTVCDRLAEVDTAYVVLLGEGAKRAREQMRAALLEEA